ncbi:LacI family DNA-binding transcriptional regulator [Pengzhenrongella frigida]|uniref:LacI family transcriptional regulator n=1 Tax=Pengzhenrongella frigida TaxID=1259133 RepID=A0A4V1ZHB4_9MICO|nr:LacI family DNA-binding transcriptional regulator [Cellulomonas sp. HLT2-17]RYV51454.1 LacI family transcriptional regulator [Cellulomonas sp. HLT2-17]
MEALPTNEGDPGSTSSSTSGAEAAAEPHTVTIYDVARAAGVGIATVSRALRGSAPVADATRAKILRVVDELGFRPSHLGTSLAEKRHAAAGIVFPDLSGPYYAEVVMGHEEAASRLGRSVLIQGTNGRTDPIAAARDLAGRVDGLVVLGRTVPDALVEEILAQGVPVVLLARPSVGNADSLRVDNLTAARALGEHLGTHHFAQVRFLGSPDSSHDVAERWAGIFQGLARSATRLDLTPCNLDEESGTRVARAVLAGPDRPDALVCANDEIALGAIVAAEEAGLTVGVDIAITGWDDIMAARHARPGLTTVRQPMRLLGAHAAEVLDERISRTRTTPRHEILPAELVVRSSCGSHPQGDRR